MLRLVWVAPFLLVAGCTSGAWRNDLARLESEISHSIVLHRAAPSGPSTDPELDKILSAALDLDTLIAAALSRNPRLREEMERVRAGLEEVHRAGALDDPMLKFEVWAVPLRQPLALKRDDTNMVGLTQNIPFPGNLNLRAESALRDAESVYQMYREVQREVIAEVKKAYYEYYRLSREFEVHLEHVRILEDFAKVSDIKFRTGTVAQQDVLRPQVELVMLHNDVLFIEQRIGTAKAAINVLLNRPDDAPLGRPRDIVPADDRYDVKDLQAKALEARPELRAALFKLQASRTGLELAEREATWPDFSIGVDYWQMPEEPDAWGGMFGINLPWFTGKRQAEARKIRHAVRGDEIAIERIRSRVLFEVRDAYLRVEAARKSLVLLRGELLPKSEQNVAVSRANYEKGKASFLDLLDAERSQRDLKLKYYQALAQYESAVADLERAVGRDLRRKS